MIKSMTGYGKGEACSTHGGFIVEIRSVNHRYGEISVRLPRTFYFAESDLKRLVSAQLKRGKIDVFVQWNEAVAESVAKIDYAAARGYYDAFANLSNELEMSRELPIELIVSQKGVLQEVFAAVDEEQLQPLLLEAVTAAVASIESMRAREGEALMRDLLERRSIVSRMVLEIGERVPSMLQEYHLRLKERVKLLLQGAELDESRICQEVALVADRVDVTEELVRLESHFVQFDETLAGNEPVGRKLDFLLQEMNREINTIGSKANDACIATLVIQVKAEMEKMREQVQNIE